MDASANIGVEHGGEARCALHPASRSVATCRRCGAYACQACWNADATLCHACVEAGHDIQPVAWESGARFGLLVTLRDLWRHPTAFFGGLPEGPIFRPLSLVFGMWALYLGFSLAFIVRNPPTLDRPDMIRELVVIVVAMAASAMGLVLAVTAPVAHAIAFALGRRVQWALTTRACLYLQTYASVALTCLLVSAAYGARLRAAGYEPIPHPERVRAFVAAGVVASIALGAMGARKFAVRRLRLSSGRAWGYAVLPAAFVAVTVGGSIAALASWGPDISAFLRAHPIP